MKKYTHLFFDLDNTLWDFKTNSKSAMEITFHAFNLEEHGLSFDQFFDVYSDKNAMLWKAYRQKEIRKKELTYKRFQLTYEDLGIQGIDADKMNEYYLTEMPKQKHLLENAHEVIAELKNKGYKLYIITNGFKEVQRKKLLSSGLDSSFLKLFISEEVKTPKPGREIFEYALKSTNARKANSLMIGDDWEVDIIGAIKFGIDAVHIDKNNTFSKDYNDAGLKGKGQITKIETLSELMKLL